MKHNLMQQPYDNQLELSYELLYLLAWLSHYEVPALKKMIDRAVKQGLKQEYFDIDPAISDFEFGAAQMSIVDFFAVLEELLIESINEDNIKKITQANLTPTLEKIDGTAYDTEMVQYSVEKATAKMAHKPEANPREILLKELLKRWKPQKKPVVN